MLGEQGNQRTGNQAQQNEKQKDKVKKYISETKLISTMEFIKHLELHNNKVFIQKLWTSTKLVERNLYH